MGVVAIVYRGGGGGCCEGWCYFIHAIPAFRPFADFGRCDQSRPYTLNWFHVIVVPFSFSLSLFLSLSLSLSLLPYLSPREKKTCGLSEFRSCEYLNLLSPQWDVVKKEALDRMPVMDEQAFQERWVVGHGSGLRFWCCLAGVPLASSQDGRGLGIYEFMEHEEFCFVSKDRRGGRGPITCFVPHMMRGFFFLAHGKQRNARCSSFSSLEKKKSRNTDKDLQRYIPVVFSFCVMSLLVVRRKGEIFYL